MFKRPTSIAIVAHHAGSLLNFRGDWIEDLTASGCKVICLAPDFSDAECANVRKLGAKPVNYHLERTGRNPFQDMLDALMLVRILKNLRPDVVFAFAIKPVIYGILAASITRVPRRVALIEGAGYALTDSGRPPGWRRRVLTRLVDRLYRLALARAHKVIFLNKDDRNEFVERKLIQRRRTAVLGGIGVDLDSWPAVENVTAPVTFMFAGRLLHEKGVEDYISAARLVKEHFPDSRFLLLGDVDSNPGSLARSQVESWVAEGLVEWPGYAPMQPWLAQTSVFVLPSYREGVPRSTQEAMAMARPIITTDVPGCRDTVEDGVNGRLVPVRNVAALADAMVEFIENPDSIITMGAASRVLAERRFDVHEINKRLNKLVLCE